MIDWKQDRIREAARDFTEWQGKAVIMVDTSDGDVWTDVFASDTNWKEYRSKTVCRLYAKDSLYGMNCKISPDAINRLIEAGTYKYDSLEDMPAEVLEVFYNLNL